MLKQNFGRKREVAELKSGNFNTRQFGERIAMNMPIQGTAADVIKLAMNRVYQQLKADFPNAKLLMQVHDELIVECRQEDAKEVKSILKTCMESVAKFKVPLEVSISIASNWLDAK